MSTTEQINLAATKIGRVQLHFFALLRDKKIRFHFAGIIRELRSITPKRAKEGGYYALTKAT